MSHVDFQQTYEGLQVLGAEYSIAVGADKRVHAAAGYYYLDIDVELRPAISSTTALESAIQFLGLQYSEAGNGMSELAIFPNDLDYLLTYRVRVDDWEVLVDAHTGSVARYMNFFIPIAAFASVRSDKRTTSRHESTSAEVFLVNGLANIYPKDPLNSSLSTNVSIYRLNGSGDKLDGVFVKVKNRTRGDAVSASSDFRYTPPPYNQPDTTHFDDANAYHHIDRFANDHWGSLGYDPFFQSEVWVNDLTTGAGQTIVRLSPADEEWWDAAKKDDIMYHEYTHNVLYDLGLGVSGSESSALHEGYADYHAATYTNDAIIGEWNAKCSDAGSGVGGRHLRTL